MALYNGYGIPRHIIMSTEPFLRWGFLLSAAEALGDPFRACRSAGYLPVRCITDPGARAMDLGVSMPPG